MSLWKRVLAERRGLVIPLLTVLAINLVLLALVVFPLERSVANDESRSTDVQLALAEARRTEQVANETRGSQQRAGEELAVFYADILPSSLAVARDLLYLQISKLSEETGIRPEQGSFELEPVDDSSLTRFKVDVALTGEYANIRRFLYRLETSEGFFVVESVGLGQAGKQQSGGGSLEVVLQVATYYTGPRLSSGVGAFPATGQPR